jgi:hypothetical protein
MVKLGNETVEIGEFSPKFMSQGVNPRVLFPVLYNVGTKLNGRRPVNSSQSHSVINPRAGGPDS